MIRWCGFLKLIVLTLLYPSIPLAAPDSPVTLDSLVEAAIENDPWFDRSRAIENALQAEAVAAGELPDPKLSATVANLPVDTFSLSQEPMTQVNLGLAQAFPAGDTRSLARRKFEQMRDMNPIERQHRIARLTLQVTQIWLDARLAEQTMALIKEDRDVFEQLVEVTRSSYRSATRRVNQQDLIRAQLELTRLDERVLRLQEQKERRLEQLTRWVPGELLDSPMDWSGSVEPAAAGAEFAFVDHPEVRLVDQRIDVSRTELDLARESKRPGWTLTTSYAWRDQDQTGRDLPDFLSVGVSMDLPLFGKNRQDKRIAAAAERVAATQSERLLKLREMKSQYRDAKTSVARLKDQSRLYREALLDQMDALAQSALDAYTSDQGDFADVMRAHIARLNARIEARRIETEIERLQAKLDYLATGIAAANGE